MAALSILLVDHDRLVREATAWILTSAGNTVTEARNGVEAMGLLEQQNRFDLVISDMSMPHMNGLALTNAVTRLWPGLPVLLVSGRAKPPGAEAFIMKPFNAEMLLRAVADVVDRLPDAPYPDL